MNRPIIFTVDFETTGKDASVAHPIEAALAQPDNPHYKWETLIALPDGETIPPESSAVHHIIDRDLEGAPSWDEVVNALWYEASLAGELTPEEVTMVAHNAEYEQTILTGTEFDGCRWVCTFRCALVAFPDAPSHSNEALRYWLGFGTGRSERQSSHSALHDCKVTNNLFNCLYGWFHQELVTRGVIDGSVGNILDPFTHNVVLEEMARISREMPKLPTCPIGKERGKKWADIDGGFLSWCLRQPDMRPDVVHCAREELERRRQSR